MNSADLHAVSKDAGGPSHIVLPMTTYATYDSSAPVDEHHDRHCLPPDDLVALVQDAPWRRLAVLGDSIAEGTGDPVPGYLDTSWAGRLASTLRRAGGQLAYRNLGVPGLRAAEIRESQLAAAVAFEPDLAVLTGGGNDVLRRSFDAGRVTVDMDAMAGALTAAGCLVVTFGLFDLSRTGLVPDAARADLHRRIEALNGAVAAVSRRHGGVHVDFFDHPVQDDPIFSADRIHPDRRGHACIATEVVRALATRLQPAGAP